MANYTSQVSTQARPTVAFLGPTATYTHQAALHHFPANEYELAPQTSIENCFAQVQSGSAWYGVVPFENSSNGSVVFTLDLFVDRAVKLPDVRVVGEVYLPINHCLVGKRTNRNNNNNNDEAPRSGTPVVPLTGIKKLYSHPQAWGQCTTFLNSYLAGVAREDMSSTSRAAGIVAEEAANLADVASDPTSSSAAISSRLAAEQFGLDILADGIEDIKGNTTRFLVLSRGARLLPSPPPSPSLTPSLSETAPIPSSRAARHGAKALVTFTVDQGQRPGALAECLGIFQRYGLNLTSITSRPSGLEPWTYVFFVEVQGTMDEQYRPLQLQQLLERGGEADNGVEGLLDRKAVECTLRDLAQLARSWRWLGSWADQLNLASNN